MKRAWTLWLAVALSATAQAVPTEPFQGVVTRVSDGDTLWVRPVVAEQGRGRPLKIRLLDLDAPEICQAGGDAARDALARYVLKRQVRVLPRARDDYGRLLARLQRDGEDVGAWLVAQGHAWSRGGRHRPGPFDAEEAQARRHGRGVFASAHAQPPWTFRRWHGPCR